MTHQTPTHFAAPPAIAGSQIDYILLDGSSSMYGQWWDVLAAIDTYVATTRAGSIQSTVKLAVFDTFDAHYLSRDVNIANWIPLLDDPIGQFGGSTPLYDAIAILGQRLRDLNPARASIIIATDGDENASTFTTADQARAIIDWMRAKGWAVTFIGCDWNNAKLAAKLGVRPEAAIGVAKKHLTDAARELAEKRVRYGRTGEDIFWTDADRKNFGGHLGFNG